ncbi:hypothetical protein [Streptomyces odonnellii]|uniref:hypothetical protein n=1 Tax=Streptomyces odonnellii TaxID=1417980 RepID=UPI0012FEFDD5|nr:hypothetical protein [Streptomyces odonnellii]
MKRWYVVRWLTGVGVMGAVMVGCGTASGGTSQSDPKSAVPSAPPSAVSDDPTLSVAADEVDGIVRSRYEDWYASTVLDHRGGVMTVYRKPGSDLDAAVRSRVSGVKLVFKDAALSEKTMLALVREILADTEYWRERDIVITGGGPLSDGSGVGMTTRAGTEAEATRLSKHYDSRVVVERGTAVAGPGERFTPSAQGLERAGSRAGVSEVDAEITGGHSDVRIPPTPGAVPAVAVGDAGAVDYL